MRAALLLGLLGCPREPGPEPDPVVPVDMVSGPVVTDNPLAGLTAWLDVSLSEPRALVIEVSHPAFDQLGRSFVVESPPAQDHHVLLAGLRADALHDLTVRAVDDEGRVAAEQTLTHETPPLPADFFLWDMGTVAPDRAEKGVTLVGFGNYLVMIDPLGAPVWYLPVQGAIHEANRLANGHLVVLVNRTMVFEIGLDGTLLSSWRAARTEEVPEGATAVDIDACHHDVLELPNGNLVSLSIERRQIEGYPGSELDPEAPSQQAWVAGDVVVEWTREGEVVGEWPLLDLLHPTRIGYDAVIGNFWEDFAPWSGDDIKDWSHGNALSYDPATDTLLVGMRHQDAVIGFSRATGELSWILAPEAGWPESLQDKVLRPASASDIVPYHMHGAKFTPEGRVLLFDNGNNRASPYETPLPDWENFSRALEVELDLAAGTWSTTFEYGRELAPSHYAGSLGDADLLPATGNVFITFGNIAHPDLGGVRLLEVTREGEIVWDLVAPYASATTQRAQRVTGLLPGL